MTEAPQKEHCKNEGRCIDFSFASNEWRKNNICRLCGCDGDTRSPTSAEVLRPDVLHFALAMEKKLRKHDNDRNGWNGAGINWLFERLLEEIEELRGEVSFDSSHPGDGHPDRESVDVGNFGMMIHSNTATTTIGDLIAELRQAKEREQG